MILLARCLASSRDTMGDPVASSYESLSPPTVIGTLKGLLFNGQ